MIEEPGSGDSIWASLKRGMSAYSPLLLGIELVTLWYQLITRDQTVHVPLVGNYVIPFMSTHLSPRLGTVGFRKARF